MTVLDDTGPLLAGILRFASYDDGLQSPRTSTSAS